LQNPSTISIIDDDESMRYVVKRLLTSLGFDAYTFASAEEFLQSPRLDDTSCLITDLQMPGMNGMELQKSLLAQDRHIPIIFMTAFPGERMRISAMKDGPWAS
jgi:FixJ family two-component response regulator